MNLEAWKEIRTLDEFMERKSAREGYIVIVDRPTSNSVIHLPSCAHVKQEGFVEKVITNESRHGSYYWTDDLDFAMYKWDAFKCGSCMR